MGDVVGMKSEGWRNSSFINVMGDVVGMKSEGRRNSSFINGRCGWYEY